jgi:hypothetical protein
VILDLEKKKTYSRVWRPLGLKSHVHLHFGCNECSVESTSAYVVTLLTGTWLATFFLYASEFTL